MIKAGLYAREGADTMTGGGPQVIICQANLRPVCTGAISPSKAHLLKPRGMQRHKGKRKPNVLRRKHTLSGPLSRLLQERNLLTGTTGVLASLE